MKNKKNFIKRYALVLLMLVIGLGLTIGAGITLGKYVSSWRVDTLKVTIAPVKYTVKHWQQKIGADKDDFETGYDYVAADEQVKQGNVGAAMESQKNEYTGFEFYKTKGDTVIKADGTAEINYYYTRNIWTLTLKGVTGIDGVASWNSSENPIERVLKEYSRTFYYDEPVTIQAGLVKDYGWMGWTGDIDVDGVDETLKEDSFNMPNHDVALTANAAQPILAFTDVVDKYGASVTYADTYEIRDSWFRPNDDTITRSTITKIVLANTYSANNPDDKWDASAAKDGSVTAYVEGTTLTIAGNGAGTIFANPDAQYTFADFANVTSIENISCLDTSTLKNGTGSSATTGSIDMAGMFRNCTNLQKLDFSNTDQEHGLEDGRFKTPFVKDMRYMFDGCTNISALNVTGFDTSIVEYFNYMFRGCATLTSLDVTNFNTSAGRYTNYMFRECRSLESLDLRNFETKNVTNMYAMFYNCQEIEEILIDPVKFDTSKVTSFGSMFLQCYELPEIDVSKFNTRKATDMSAMFLKCESLTELKLTPTTESEKNSGIWDVSNVTTFKNTFSGCTALTTLDVSTWNTSSATNMGNMFAKCSSLTQLDVSNFRTGNVTGPGYYEDLGKDTQGFEGMFEECTSLESLDLSHFDTSKATSFRLMFHNCKALVSIDLWCEDIASGKENYKAVPYWEVHNARSFDNMFSSCEKLESLDLSGWVPGYNTTEGQIVEEVVEANISTNSMFSACGVLTTIYADCDWDATLIQDSTGMFQNCYVLKGGAETKYVNNLDPIKISAVYARIDGGPESATPGYFTLKSSEGTETPPTTETEEPTEPTEPTEPVPEYVQTAAEALAATVKSRQSEDTLSFIAVSDTHFTSTHSSYNTQMAESLLHLGQAVNIVRQNADIDFATMLGDIIWDDGETHEEALAAMDAVYEALYPGFNGIQNFWAVGNHDSIHSSSDRLTLEQIYTKIGAHNAGAIADPNNPKAGYCYYDFEEYKLRVILYNTSDSPTNAVSKEQDDWMKEVLDLSSKGGEWRSLLLSHVPLDQMGRNYYVMKTIEEADGVIANIHGDIHNYKVDYLGNSSVKRIAIPNACFWRSNECGQNGVPERVDPVYGDIEYGEAVTYSKTANSAEDTAFCVVTINFEEEKIYVDHYGAGYDRVVSYSESIENYSITANLTNVTSSNSASTVVLGGEYITTLTEADGYVMDEVTVYMGGKDVTDSVYSGRKVAILSVTGDVVITAKAILPAAATYTNVVPTAQSIDSTAPYNGTGYKNGYYLSSTQAQQFEGANSTTVLTGYIPYTVPASGAPATIYIKGAQWKDDYYSRMIFFDSTKNTGRVWIQGNKDNIRLTDFFTVETLGTDYFKLTPILKTNGQSKLYASGIAYMRMSLHGTGNDLIITLNEPIE